MCVKAMGWLRVRMCRCMFSAAIPRVRESLICVLCILCEVWVVMDGVAPSSNHSLG